MLYQFNMPFPHFDGSQYVRNCTMMHASPGVTWQEIVAEADSKGDGKYLETVTVCVHWYVVSLTVRGFCSIAQNFHHEDDPEADFEKRKANLAKELVSTRDYMANGGSDRKDHSQWDYWPKD